MCMFVVAVLVAAVVLGTVFNLGWPAAVGLGVVAVLAMGLWETISRPWKVREAFHGERARLLHAGWAEEDANLAARDYVRQKFNLQ